MDNQQTLTEAVKDAAEDRDGRAFLACAKAFLIARKFSVPVKRVGDVCNAEGIKIAQCQLGCFK